MAVHRLNYFKNLNNYLELFLYIAAILFTLPRGDVEFVNNGHLIQVIKMIWLNSIDIMTDLYESESFNCRDFMTINLETILPINVNENVLFFWVQQIINTC